LLTENHITSYCTISKNMVSKNGAVLFGNKDVDLSAFLLSAYQHFQLNYPKFYKMDNLSKLGWLAAEILLRECFDKTQYQPEDVGVVLANASSSLDDDLKYFETAKDVASPALFVYTLPNIVIGEICIRNHFKGEHAFFIQETFDADFIAMQVNHLLNKNSLRACICGWVEVLDQDYKAVLFLVEKQNSDDSALFSAQNMDSIFKKS
jgi:hypothetical protein